MKITLLGHSGFLVEGNTACLVFDYYTDGRKLLEKLPMGKKTVFFASHSHYDHYNSKILEYAKAGAVGYALGTGIHAPRVENAVMLDKGQSAEVLGIPVKAFGSTDAGVSFLVQMEGKTLFHAGDLNDWYWEDESTPQELLHDEKWFLDEIVPLKDAAPDIAFFPMDARLGPHALRGALHFARTVRPGLIVPMHLCGGHALPGELMAKLKEAGLPAQVADIAHPGDSMDIS